MSTRRRGLWIFRFAEARAQSQARTMSSSIAAQSVFLPPRSIVLPDGIGLSSQHAISACCWHAERYGIVWKESYADFSHISWSFGVLNRILTRWNRRCDLAGHGARAGPGGGCDLAFSQRHSHRAHSCGNLKKRCNTATVIQMFSLCNPSIMLSFLLFENSCNGLWSTMFTSGLHLRYVIRSIQPWPCRLTTLMSLPLPAAFCGWRWPSAGLDSTAERLAAGS